MEKGMTADEVIKALWRRKAVVGAVSLVVFLLGLAVVLGMPASYRATAVVHLEQQHLAPELVQKTVSETMEQRLLDVRQELEGRPVLEKVIQELNLYPSTVSKKGMDAAIQEMRSNLDVKPAGETAFELSYTADDPKVVALVVDTIPRVFAENLTRLRQDQAQRATTLFAGEIDALKAAVTDWEQRIARFKVDHLGELPEQLESNMRSMESVAHEITTKSEELRAMEARRSDLARSHYGVDTEAGRLGAAEDGLHQQLVQARTQWTEDHPEVKRLEQELNRMQAARVDAEGRMVAEQQERARSTRAVGTLAADLDSLQKQLGVFQKRLEDTPRWAQQLGVLERDHEITRAKYQSMVSRKVEAEVAQELEAKSAPHLVNIISPAIVPVSPYKPDRLNGLVVSLLVALALGVLSGVFLEMRDDSIREPHQVTRYLPVLAMVPELGGRRQKRTPVQPFQDRSGFDTATTLN